MSSSSSAPLIHLHPPPIPHAGSSKWSASGRSISSALSPSSSDLAVFVTPKRISSENNVDVPASKVDGVFDQDRAVYFGKYADVKEGLNELYTSSHAIFSSLQEIYTSSLASHLSHLASLATNSSAQPLALSQLGSIPKSANDEDGIGSFGNVYVSQDQKLRPSETQIGYYRAIMGEYRKRVDSVCRDEANELSLRIQHRIISSILSLATVLYLPPPGQSTTIIGEQLLDWLNASHASPTLSRPNVLRVTAARRSWEEEEYWPIVFKAILRGLFSIASTLLTELHSHPQRSISSFANILTRHLDSAPRSTDTAYGMEHQFYNAHVSWRNALKSQVTAFGRGKPRGEWFEFESEGPREDEVDEDVKEKMRDWEEYLMTVGDLLMGDEEVVLRECEDWKEAVGCWGVLVDVALKRDDLPTVLDRILDERPADSTLVEENILTALIEGDVSKALTSCNDFDLWLAAHLTDLLDKMGLVEDDEEAFELPLRDYFILAYTDILQSNPGYWNITCDYLKTCGEPGIGRMRVVLLRAGLDDVPSPVIDGDEGMDVDAGAQEGSKQRTYEKINDVLSVCSKNGLEEELRQVCKNAATKLAREEQFAEALTYAARSGEGRLITIIADQMLDLYITDGIEAFSEAAGTVPLRLITNAPTHAFLSTSSQTSTSDASDTLPPLPPIPRLRLTFLVKFREFLIAVKQADRQRAAKLLVAMFASGVVPQSFWAVLLMDSVEYLNDHDVLLSAKDTFELLRHVEDIAQSSRYAPESYLSALYRLTSRTSGQGRGKADDKPDYKETMKALDLVRIAGLANLGRTGMDLVGGWS